jgi:hypothetical protein
MRKDEKSHPEMSFAFWMTVAERKHRRADAVHFKEMEVNEVTRSDQIRSDQIRSLLRTGMFEELEFP